MTSEEVVNDALDCIEEIRSYNFPPHRIICMDETGLWSNVTKPKTYHFKNWCDISQNLLTPLTFGEGRLTDSSCGVLFL